MHITDYNGIMVNHKQLEHMLRDSWGYDRDRYRYDQKMMGSAAGACEDWSFEQTSGRVCRSLSYGTETNHAAGRMKHLFKVAVWFKRRATTIASGAAAERARHKNKVVW